MPDYKLFKYLDVHMILLCNFSVEYLWKTSHGKGLLIRCILILLWISLDSSGGEFFNIVKVI